MKNQKGITITSLVIYIIGLLIVIGTLSMFLDYYYSNIKENTYSEGSAEEYSKLTMYLTEEFNSKDIKNISCSSEYIYLQMNNDGFHEYIYQNKCIYYIERDKDKNVIKQIELCNNVETCIFNYDNIKNSINVIVNINGKEYNNIYTEII